MVRSAAFSASMYWVLITYIVISSSTLVLMQDQLSNLLSKRAAMNVSQTRPVVMTDSGPVRGVIEDGIHVFKGIPYAEPPINDKRWKAPVPPGKSSGIRDASTFGSKCVQPISPANFSTITGSEDCLFLNVWSPIRTRGAPPLPVIFWIHGGGQAFFSGNEPDYSPTTELVSDMGAVIVGVNFRLGAFGFLSLDLLDTQSDTGTSGNYAILDNILALKWVQTNIANFGGNPNKVTILGHSSGGTSVIALLSSPLARGLFQRAWSSSPAMIFKSAAEAKKDNKVFLTKAGCQNVSCLRSLTAEQVFQSSPWFVPPLWTLKDLNDLPVKGVFNGGLLITDGYVIPENPLDAWRDGKGNSVPTVFGTTSQELDLFLSVRPPSSGISKQGVSLFSSQSIANWTWTQYRAVVKQKLDTFGPAITQRALQLYPESTSLTPEFQYSTMGSDIRSTCPTDVVADVADSYFNAEAYRYIVTQAPSSLMMMPPMGSARYAAHLWDVYAFFGSLGGLTGKVESSDIEFVGNIRQEIMHFAETGRPKSADWLPFKINTALLGGNTTVVDSYSKVRCSFWMKNGFFPYAWVD